MSTMCLAIEIANISMTYIPVKKKWKVPVVLSLYMDGFLDKMTV